jgi:quercetin dioxygenase-like cupin family protein
VLVGQGAESLRLWTGLEPPLAVMHEAARADRQPDEGERSEAEPGEGEAEAEELQITPTESIHVIRSDQEVLEVEAVYAAEGKAPPKHLHPDQDEHFEVLEGSLRVRVGGEEKDLGAGENREAVVVWETRPAGRTREWFAAIDRLYREGKVGGNGEPGPLAFAALLSEYDDVFRLAVGPSFLVQGALGLLAPLGRARGYLDR